MAIDIVKKSEWILELEKFIQRVRPSEEIRNQLDISYKIENQSVIIHEIRPQFDNPMIKIFPDVAKATFVKSKNIWKVYWMRADLRWHGYGPCPIVSNLSDFLKLVDEDSYSCFWG
jgi:hypothetical protein